MYPFMDIAELIPCIHAYTELYDFCVKEGIADQALIGKWRKVWI